MCIVYTREPEPRNCLCHADVTLRVAPEHRGAGLGTLLVESICSEPVLQNVASIELVCQPELVPLYEKWGFSENVARSRLMRRTAVR